MQGTCAHSLWIRLSQVVFIFYNCDTVWSCKVAYKIVVCIFSHRREALNTGSNRSLAQPHLMWLTFVVFILAHCRAILIVARQVASDSASPITILSCRLYFTHCFRYHCLLSSFNFCIVHHLSSIISTISSMLNYSNISRQPTRIFSFTYYKPHLNQAPNGHHGSAWSKTTLCGFF